MDDIEMFYGAPHYLFEIARELRKKMTPTEKILWQRLRDYNLEGIKFRRQHPIFNYIADFYCHKTKLVIEIDGGIHNRQRDYDIQRDQDMMELGIKVIRFKNEQVMKDLNNVLRTIEVEIQEFTSP
jgi:imidazole glycerol-phosphate synthase subunit HisF